MFYFVIVGKGGVVFYHENFMGVALNLHMLIIFGKGSSVYAQGA